MMSNGFQNAVKISKELNEKVNTILDYMTLHIKGAGRGLSDEELQWLNGLSDETWDAITIAIIELGGSPPGDPPNEYRPPSNPSDKTLSLGRTLRDFWMRADQARMSRVASLLHDLGYEIERTDRRARTVSR
jgi:hypothetical protein